MKGLQWGASARNSKTRNKVPKPRTPSSVIRLDRHNPNAAVDGICHTTPSPQDTIQKLPVPLP